MNNIQQYFEEAPDIQQFSKRYFAYVCRLLGELDLKAIKAFSREMMEARKKHNTIFVAGNGGSAGTASHMANDLGVGVMKNGNTDLPFRVLAITDNVPAMLAIANDEGYDRLFIDQLRIHYRKGDKLIAISASGNSPNVLAAARWVKERGGVVMSLVGFDGGKLKAMSDVAIHVKSNKGEYGPVEDVHMIIGHLLAGWLQYNVLKEEAA